ncbi:hypothetical protein CASFOL_041979 [Castilleja foliolosa]|uniref:Uncharacterized protein n=2 Tax=Castilleja foliolosa TaxID=1961234 RepID=A0ABD3B973_9LAMI
MAERGGGKGRGRPRKRGREESSTEEISDHSTNLEDKDTVLESRWIGMKTIPSLVIGYTDKLGKLRCKRGKGRNVAAIPHSSYEWETVATNFDEFVNVSKLFLSTNRTEVAVGKKLKNNMLPEIEKVHKRKEKLLKKQNRQALMLDNMMNMDGLVAGRSLRDRKPVTYTFDRSINEAIKVTNLWKKQLSPEPYEKREHFVKIEGSSNGGSRWGDDNSPSQYP